MVRVLPNNREILQKSLDYIELHLKADITADELADMAGFSLYYYYRLFQGTVGMPVMQYILRRRLLNAIYEISCGRKMIDTALEYGFDTHAGFFKAFVREFGSAPSRYVKGRRVRKPHSVSLLQEGHIMLTHKKVVEALMRWGLGNETVSDIYYQNTGQVNDHAFYVGTNRVVKFSANLGALKNSAEISKAIVRQGLAAAVPIPALDGSEYVAYGDLYCVLTNRLEGAQINSMELFQQGGEEKARAIGEAIGKLHLILAGMEDIAANDEQIFATVDTWALPRAEEILQLPEGFAGDYRTHFGGLINSLPKQLIHRDPNPGNLIAASGQIGFIDFDISERNIRIFDPCYAATAILSECFVNSGKDSGGREEKLCQWHELFKSILLGYDSAVHLSREEKLAIPYAVWSIQMICMAYFSTQNKFEDLFKVNVEMVEWLLQNRKALQIF